MRKYSIVLLALATALAIAPAALAQQSGDFSFATAQALGGFSGSGTFTTDSTGVITDLTGTFLDGSQSYQMALIAAGGFASNDNSFTDSAPYVDQNGLSFSAGGENYNIFYYGVSDGYGVTGSCGLEGDCITNDPTGNPSEPVSFTASNVTPEPGSLLLLGTGLLGLAFVLFRKNKPSRLVLHS